MNNRLTFRTGSLAFQYTMSLTIPLFIFTVFDKLKRTCLYDCGENGRRIYFSVFGFGVFLAMSVICFCYWRIIKGFYFGKQKVCVSEDLQHKRKVVKLLLLITLAFIVCFTSRIIYFLFYYSTKGSFHQISLFLLHCNSAIFPIILGFESENDRKGFKEIITKTKRIIR